MKALGHSGFSLMETVVATGLATGVALGTAALIKGIFKNGNDAALAMMRDQLVQQIHKVVSDPRNMRLSATSQGNTQLNKCINVNGNNPANACTTNVYTFIPASNKWQYVPDPYKFDLYDSTTNRIVAGGQNPARYDKQGKPCTGSGSAACPYEAVATMVAKCASATAGGPPTAQCSQARTYEVFIDVHLTASVAALEPVRQIGSSMHGALPVYGKCADGTTLTGLNSDGSPICTVKGHSAAAPAAPGAQCAPGQYLFSYNPQLTNNGVICRTLAAVCPAGSTYVGQTTDVNGNVVAQCTVYAVPQCPPNFYVNQVNWDNRTVNCVTPGFSTCGVNMVQQGNTVSGAPNCVYYTVALPSLDAYSSMLQNTADYLVAVRNNMTSHKCLDRPVRPIMAFDGGGTPICRNPWSDYDGDGWPDMVVGAGDQGGPRVNVLSGARGDDANNPIANFFAYDPNIRTGVSVGLTDVDGDGFADVLTMPNAPGGGPALGIFYGPPGSGRASQQFVIDTTGQIRTGYTVGP